MSEHKHDTACIVCCHVVEGDRPVLEVIHEEDGFWQFLCGREAHGSADTARLACFACVMKTDPTLAGVADLPNGTWADRDAGDGRWHRYRLEQGA